uniref:Dopey_N domain-containing protein n=1 Tax=Bursaphelenchus xylophilus TaxID=6326 RepID=A0A1I7S1B1_BURXY
MTSVHPLEPTNNSTKYRNYAASVDKALKAFEYTNDWADLIASLGKLCKVFQSHARSFDDIPKTVTVAKRLSQCLHPALPSGVHLKTLDTYKQVFSVLGQSDKLARCLYLFTIGLFPLMDNCGIKVKLELMSVFEKFLLPLGPKIRPALPGFIAAILFALEEGTDFYNPAIELLDQVMESSGPLSFYACLWQAVRGSPAVRLPALIFVNSKFDKRKPIDDQLAVISGGSLHADYMTDALCAVAEDPGNPLVQRNLLDFLCTAIPLNSAHVAQSDLVQILKRCLFVVLRRDMSLNRRLYQWLLNRQSDGAQPALGGAEELTDLDFFYTYSIPLIRLAIADFLPQQTVEIPVNTSPLPLSDSWKDHRNFQVQFTEVRLCRLLHYFLDRPELGTPILRETLLMFLEYACRRDIEMVRELQTSCEQTDPSFSFGTLWESWSQNDTSLDEGEKERRLDEIRKTFNSLLTSLEPNFLWDYLGDLFLKLLQPLPYKTDLSDEEEASLTIEERDKRQFEESKRKEHLMLYPLMIVFCVKNVRLDAHEDIRNRHISSLLKRILDAIDEKGCETFSRDNVVALLCVCRRLLAEIGQNAALLEPESSTTIEKEDDTLKDDTLNDSRISKVVINKKIEDQKVVEDCSESCKNLTVQICNWPEKATQTFLLKPFIPEAEMHKLEESGFFKKSALILWSHLEEQSQNVNALTVSKLLLRLHSRRSQERSSEVEEIIVQDLTSNNRLTSLRAAVKFRVMWALNRDQEETVDPSPKPLNKVVMVFLGFMAYENKNVEVRDVAYTWFSECAECGDLHKILQVRLGRRIFWVELGDFEGFLESQKDFERLFDPTELPNLTSPGDAKQPLLDETHAHMLLYAESPRVVDLSRAEEIFRIMSALLKNNTESKLGKMIVACMLFTNTAQLQQNPASAGCAQQLLEALARHYKHIQGKGFWGDDESPKSESAQNEKARNPTFFEIFCTILLYFLRSYYLNSPTTTVSKQDLERSIKCKIVAMECFSELLRVVNELIREFKCREFVNFVQQSYRLSRTQRVVISLMLTMVPAPPNQKSWR